MGESGGRDSRHGTKKGKILFMYKKYRLWNNV